ncbi:MAG: hypothetical protein ABI691_21295 [Ginsengibacter sp.]
MMKLTKRKAKILARVKPPLESIANVLIASAGIPPESVMHASKTIYRKTIGRL